MENIDKSGEMYILPDFAAKILSALKIHYLDKSEITLRTDCQAIISFYNKSAQNKPSRVRQLIVHFESLVFSRWKISFGSSKTFSIFLVESGWRLSLRGIDFCTKIPVPGYYQNDRKKYGIRKSGSYNGKPHSSHFCLYSQVSKLSIKSSALFSNSLASLPFLRIRSRHAARTHLVSELYKELMEELLQDQDNPLDGVMNLMTHPSVFVNLQLMRGGNSQQKASKKMKNGLMFIDEHSFRIPFIYCFDMNIGIDGIQMLIGCNFIRAMQGGLRIEGNSITFYKNITTVQTSIESSRAAIPEFDLEENEYLSIQESLFYSVPITNKFFEQRFQRIFADLKERGFIGENPLQH
ncbi:hypothetical protein Ancab_007824 [Ancistrocladus abbreviatus]